MKEAQTNAGRLERSNRDGLVTHIDPNQAQDLRHTDQEDANLRGSGVS
jgi:hypothetical protein